MIQPGKTQPATCSSSSPGGMAIASFIIAIVAVCLGVPALVMSIINTVRISRMKRRFAVRDCEAVVQPAAAPAASAETNNERGTPPIDGGASAPALFHPTMKPPYYACIFTSRHNLTESNAIDGYGALADEMDELAKRQEGYLGIDSSSRSSDGLGITVSYWASNDAMKKWKKQVDHASAQILGKGRFYSDYHVHIAKVEREYGLNT